MSKKNPASWFYYFDERVKGIVTCKAEKCGYTKTLDKSRSTNSFSCHIQNHHPELFKQREQYIATQKEQQQKILHSNPLKRSFAKAFTEAGPSSADVLPQPEAPILLALKAKRPWDPDGPATASANEALMQFLATSAKPFNLVENVEFRKFCQILQPNYTVPGRKHFSQYELPQFYSKIKSNLIHELESIDFCSLTTDGWTSKDNKHSIISLTCHYIDANFRPVFRVIGTKPIKGRHTADAIISLLKANISEYGLTDKIFAVTRDTENTMKKVTRDLGVKSVDCTAHLLQLCVKDGLRLYNEEDSLSELFERMKKFVRKVRKSRVLSMELADIQKMEDLPVTALIKDIEVRWNTLFLMIDRFIKNKSSIALLSIDHPELPTFSSDDWRLFAIIKSILEPIYEATMELQNRESSIGIIIPLYRTIIHILRKNEEEKFSKAKTQIIASMEARFLGIDDRKEFVIATILDPRFKSAPYLDNFRMEEYKEWVISAAEELQKPTETLEELLLTTNRPSESSEEGIFSQFEKDTAEFAEFPYLTPIASPPTIEARKKAELEVNDYLRDKKLRMKADPFEYWRVNSGKWPLLGKLVRKFHSAPATSSESERLFSSAGLIVSDLRKSLLPENLEMLLFLHHNIILTNV